jgi:hypothetical protein
MKEREYNPEEGLVMIIEEAKRKKNPLEKGCANGGNRSKMIGEWKPRALACMSQLERLEAALTLFWSEMRRCIVTAGFQPSLFGPLGF